MQKEPCLYKLYFHLLMVVIHLIISLILAAIETSIRNNFYITGKFLCR